MDKPEPIPMPLTADPNVTIPMSSLKRRGTLVSVDGSLKRSKQFEGSLVHYPDSAPVQLTKAEAKIVDQTQSPFLSALALEDFVSPVVWRACFIEFCGTTVLTYLSMFLVTTSINNVNQGTKSLQPWAALWHIPALAIFITACAPASGGHLSPTITLGTLVTRMITPARALMYVVCQFLGGAAAGGLVKATLPPELAPLGLCYINLTSVGPGLTPSQALCAEFVFTYILLFIAWHVAFDPKQFNVFGPIGAPWLVGLTIGMVLYAGGFAAPGYTGPALTIARCIPTAWVITGLQGYEWFVYFLGDLLAGVALGVTYYIAPPDHATWADR